ncbi:MAG: AAA family ATPase [Candidatus Omnitrophica bacterium]|nr:AAA family ATPase [Candidatus Omnitrophota bacterium]
MTIKNESNIPSPEEIQRQLSEFFNQQFRQDKRQPPQEPDSEKVQEGGGKPAEEKKSLRLNLKPKEVKAHLDRFVVHQEEAKRILAIGVCDHYNHVADCADGNAEKGEYAKQNILLLGPTGVGKTYLIRCLAELIGVPLVKADATKFSETGYVGGDVEDLVRELVQKADGDVERARYGMIYLDEVDKIASSSNVLGKDVSGAGVQRNLLKLMEDTEVPLRNPMDVAGQMQALMDLQKGGKKGKTLSTKHILFIVSGAFDGLREIVNKRLNRRQIGFTQDFGEDETALLRKASTADLIEFGFESEFVGRLPVRVACEPLGQEELYQILKNSEGSIVHQHKASFKAYGIDMKMTDGALRKLAERAAEEGTGARGLVTVCEQLFRNFKYELPSSKIKRFVVDELIVEEPDLNLARWLEDPSAAEMPYRQAAVAEFVNQFHKRVGVWLDFDAHALTHLAERSLAEQKEIADLCGEIFADYHYGLKLIAKEGVEVRFPVTEEVLNDPAGTLDTWIRETYAR